MTRANFDNIQLVLDDLIKQRDSKDKQPVKFDMRTYMSFTPPYFGDVRPRPTLGAVRRGAFCNTAACLAGETVLILGVPESVVDVCALDSPSVDGESVHTLAMTLLNLDYGESNHMFCGDWSTKTLRQLSIDDAIEYLTKAIDEKDVYVMLPSREVIL